MGWVSLRATKAITQIATSMENKANAAATAKTRYAGAIAADSVWSVMTDQESDFPLSGIDA